MRPLCPEDDDRDNVDKHRDDDNNNENDNHHGLVETVAVESDGANCYRALGGRNNRRRDWKSRMLPGTHW